MKVDKNSLLNAVQRGFKTATFVAVFSFTSLSVFAADFGRSKVIDFEDSLVEGVNKQPLDSLSQISDQMRKRKRPHLYRKRGGFRSENAESLSEMRFTQ